MRMSYVWIFVSAFFQVVGGHFFTVSLYDGENESPLQSLFYKVTNSIHEVSTLMT